MPTQNYGPTMTSVDGKKGYYFPVDQLVSGATSCFDPQVIEVFEKNLPPNLERKGTQDLEEVVVLCGVTLTPNKKSPSEGFSVPDGFRFPRNEESEAYRATARLARRIKHGRNIFVYGEAGTGKSATCRAILSKMRRETSHYAMTDSTDPELFIGRMSITEENGASVTKFIPGRLLEDIQGRLVTRPDGTQERVPVTILVDDIDRGPAEAHEIFRHVLDPNARHLFVAELGKNVPVFEGTQIIATANSNGRGDMSGVYSSVNEMDASMLERFEGMIEFHALCEEDELEVLVEKYPTIPPTLLKRVVVVTSSIRSALQSDQIFGAFSHRHLTQWMQSALELALEHTSPVSAPILLEAFEDVLDRYDKENRQAIGELCHAVLGGSK